MSNYPHTVIPNGFRCMVSGKEFHAVDGSRAARHAAYREQQQFTRELMLELEKGRKQRLTLTELQTLYREKEEHENG